MNFSIKEVEINNIYDYLMILTKGFVETYIGIMSNKFLEKIQNRFEYNFKRNEDKFENNKKN